MTHFFNHKLFRKNILSGQFEHQLQRMLNKRTTRRGFQASAFFFRQQMRGVIGSNYIQSPIFESLSQGIAIGNSFNGRIPFKF
jgi:hypothetical protein